MWLTCLPPGWSLWEDSLARLRDVPAHLEALKLYLANSDYKEIAAKTGLS